MEASILKTIQDMLGSDSSYDVFTSDILIHINSAISVLTQLGVGPKDVFRITGVDETWEDLLSNDKILEFVKTYIYLKVRLVFDPPSNSSLVTFYKQECDEIESRILYSIDPRNS